MIYRMRVYDAVPEHLETFHDVFRNHLLPVQLKHGARLVGRWETDDARVVAVWEYDDAAACARIEAAVRDDPESQWSQSRRGALPPLFRGYDEVFMRSTMPV